MELSEQESQQSVGYLSAYNRLIGDKRTEQTFRDVIYGIIGSESLKTSRIARFSPWAGEIEIW